MINTYFPLKVHTHFSLGTGISKPNYVARRCAEIGLPGAAVTDIDSMSGSIGFSESMEKRKLKQIIGCEFSIVKDHAEKTKNCSTMTLIARNYKGWLELVKCISLANTHYYFEKPHITVEEIAQLVHPENVFAIGGWLGSDIGDTIFQNPKEIYLASSYEAAKNATNKNWFKDVSNKIARYKEIFGDSFYLGSQLVEVHSLHESRLIHEGMSYAGM